MQVLLAVVADLYHFFRDFFLNRKEVVVTPVTLPLPGPTEQRLLSPLHPATMVVPAAAPEPEAPAATPSWSRTGGLLVATASASLHHDPTEAFDNVVAHLPYATGVSEVRRSGRWLLVEASGQTGWVLADAVAPEHEVMPQFTRGHVYDASHGETAKLRACIQDSFQGARAGVPLSGVEYVTYRLLRAGRVLPWPQTYNRLAGTWQRKLRGVRGVHIDVLPHTGSVMEYIIDDVGYVGYVERVAPDLKIVVTGIGLTNESQYTEQTLDHSLWRELRPVFIQVS